MSEADAGWLDQRSLELLCRLQSDSGAFIASPSVSQYRFCWLRDGSFIAHALQTRGLSEQSRAFHDWASRAINAQAPAVAGILERRAAGVDPDVARMLPTRFTLDGDLEPQASAEEAWPNFQLDGYGTWLWALAEHVGAGPLGDESRAAARLAADYLAACWQMPCFDWWEEFGERRHTSTLASVAAGLRAAAGLLDDARYAHVAEQVLRHISMACVRAGRFVKGPDDDRVDASLLTLGVPFGLVALDDPRFVATVRSIESELQTPRGGVWRYPGDTFFGGGAWILLTSRLGWYYALVGDEEKYARCESWVRSAADADGSLPEQLLGDECQSRSWAHAWTKDGARPGDPLLWSHAEYLLMRQARLSDRASPRRPAA